MKRSQTEQGVLMKQEAIRIPLVELIITTTQTKRAIHLGHIIAIEYEKLEIISFTKVNDNH